MTELEPLPHYGNRVRELRERAGRCPAEMAVAIGDTVANYWDLEDHASEILIACDLGLVRRVAAVLGVPLRQLLSPTPERGQARPEFTFADLAVRLKAEADKHGLENVENAVGWRLDHFIANPAVAWAEPLDFLRLVCRYLEVDWMQAIPAQM